LHFLRFFAAQDVFLFQVSGLKFQVCFPVCAFVCDSCQIYFQLFFVVCWHLLASGCVTWIYGPPAAGEPPLPAVWRERYEIPPEK
jgi:hypothetical protein